MTTKDYPYNFMMGMLGELDDEILKIPPQFFIDVIENRMLPTLEERETTILLEHYKEHKTYTEIANFIERKDEYWDGRKTVCSSRVQQIERQAFRKLRQSGCKKLIEPLIRMCEYSYPYNLAAFLGIHNGFHENGNPYIMTYIDEMLYVMKQADPGIDIESIHEMFKNDEVIFDTTRLAKVSSILSIHRTLFSANWEFTKFTSREKAMREAICYIVNCSYYHTEYAEMPEKFHHEVELMVDIPDEPLVMEWRTDHLNLEKKLYQVLYYHAEMQTIGDVYIWVTNDIRPKTNYEQTLYPLQKKKAKKALDAFLKEYLYK